MSKEGLKSKPKKVKKLKKDAKVVPEMKSQEEAPTAESYVAGEVAGSLFSKTSNQDATPLLSLFDIKACAVQPLYVPVVVTKTKPVETEAPKPSKSSAVAPQVSAKKSKKELSEAEKKVEDRERALTNADADEETKRSTDKNLKTKKRLADEETAAELAQKKRRIMAEERVKNKRTVFVGNLPVSCTKQMLKSCFKDFGHIESMRFRSVARADPTESRKVAAIHRKVHPKRKSINAYIVFKEQESASKALARNGNEISSGFHIRVDLASKSSSHDKKKTVFVGNLPYDIHDEALREHFSECGTVDGVRIIRDQYSGIGKGFGYVLFQASDAVQLALKLENSELMGRKIRVKRCLTTDAQKTPKQAPAKQSAPGKKAPFQKKNTFVGETADGAVKRKNKKPKMKKKKINL